MKPKFQNSIQAPKNFNPAASDDDVIGSYIENHPEEPQIPDGSYANTIVAHIPKVVKLTYAQMIRHLFKVETLVVENHLCRALQERFESDPRLEGYRLHDFPFDLYSKVIIVGRADTDFGLEKDDKWHERLSRADLARDGYSLGRYIEQPGKTFRIFEVIQDDKAVSGLTYIADTKMDEGILVRVKSKKRDFFTNLVKSLPGATLHDAI